MTCATRRANSTIASSTPAMTPSARLPVATVIATVTTMTMVSGPGIRFSVAGAMLCQLMVLSATIIITAASATIGICAIRSLSAVTSTSSTSAATIGRDAGAGPADLHVDDGLADHGAAGDAAVKAGGDVGDAERPGFPALVRAGVGEIVDQLGGQQRFQQPDERDAERRRPDDLQGCRD